LIYVFVIVFHNPGAKAKAKNVKWEKLQKEKSYTLLCWHLEITLKV